MPEVLRTAHTFQLQADEPAEIRALLDDAFAGDFTDDDWDHCLGGVHALLRDSEGILVAHGSVVQRRLLHAGRSCRVGYVEAVAVRVGHRGRGFGGRVMEALEEVIDGAYRAGALSASDDGALLYTARGWLRRPGRIGTLTPRGVVRLPDEEGSVYLRQAAGHPLPGPEGELIFDWREGDVL